MEEKVQDDNIVPEIKVETEDTVNINNVQQSMSGEVLHKDEEITGLSKEDVVTEEQERSPGEGSSQTSRISDGTLNKMKIMLKVKLPISDPGSGDGEMSQKHHHKSKKKRVKIPARGKMLTGVYRIHGKKVRLKKCYVQLTRLDMIPLNNEEKMIVKRHPSSRRGGRPLDDFMIPSYCVEGIGDLDDDTSGDDEDSDPSYEPGMEPEFCTKRKKKSQETNQKTADSAPEVKILETAKDLSELLLAALPANGQRPNDIKESWSDYVKRVRSAPTKRPPPSTAKAMVPTKHQKIFPKPPPGTSSISNFDQGRPQLPQPVGHKEKHNPILVAILTGERNDAQNDLLSLRDTAQPLMLNQNFVGHGTGIIQNVAIPTNSNMMSLPAQNRQLLPNFASNFAVPNVTTHNLLSVQCQQRPLVWQQNIGTQNFVQNIAVSSAPVDQKAHFGGGSQFQTYSTSANTNPTNSPGYFVNSRFGSSTKTRQIMPKGGIENLPSHHKKNYIIPVNPEILNRQAKAKRRLPNILQNSKKILRQPAVTRVPLVQPTQVAINLTVNPVQPTFQLPLNVIISEDPYSQVQIGNVRSVNPKKPPEPRPVVEIVPRVDTNPVPVPTPIRKAAGQFRAIVPKTYPVQLIVEELKSSTKPGPDVPCALKEKIIVKKLSKELSILPDITLTQDSNTDDDNGITEVYKSNVSQIQNLLRKEVVARDLNFDDSQIKDSPLKRRRLSMPIKGFVMKDDQQRKQILSSKIKIIKEESFSVITSRASGSSTEKSRMSNDEQQLDLQMDCCESGPNSPMSPSNSDEESKNIIEESNNLKKEPISPPQNHFLEVRCDSDKKPGHRTQNNFSDLDSEPSSLTGYEEAINAATITEVIENFLSSITSNELKKNFLSILCNSDSNQSSTGYLTLLDTQSFLQMTCNSLDAIRQLDGYTLTQIITLLQYDASIVFNGHTRDSDNEVNVDLDNDVEIIAVKNGTELIPENIDISDIPNVLTEEDIARLALLSEEIFSDDSMPPEIEETSLLLDDRVNNADPCARSSNSFIKDCAEVLERIISATEEMVRENWSGGEKDSIHTTGDSTEQTLQSQSLEEFVGDIGLPRSNKVSRDTSRAALSSNSNVRTSACEIETKTSKRPSEKEKTVQNVPSEPIVSYSITKLPMLKAIKCFHCDKIRQSERSLLNHIRKTHLTFLPPWICFVCNNTNFKKKGTLWKHYQRCHFKKYLELPQKHYRCDHCTKVFISRTSLLGHVSVRNGVQRYQCETCDKRFPSRCQLSVHIRGVHGEKEFTCQMCDDVLTSNSELQKHMAAHSDERPHVCTICKRAFWTRKNLEKHLLFHVENSMRSKMCNLALAHQQSTETHLKIVHSSTLKHKCFQCQKLFHSVADLTDHVTNHHQTTTKVKGLSKRSKKQQPHNYSGSRDNNVSDKPNVSIKLKIVHRTVVEHQCPLCQAHFNSKDGLEEHGSAQHQQTAAKIKECPVNEKPNKRPFNCNICEKAFCFEKTLNNHTLIHKKDRLNMMDSAKNKTCSKIVCLFKAENECSLCPQNFDSKEDLIEHGNAQHQQKAAKVNERPASKKRNKRPYKCEVCEKPFRFEKTLNKHRAIHKKESHHCGTCNLSFIAKVNASHNCVEMLPPTEAVHDCSLCLQHFDSRLQLTEHGKVLHQQKDLITIANYFENTKPNENLHKCDTCKKGFLLTKTLDNHTIIHLRDSSDYVYNKPELESHSRLLHPNEVLLQCPECQKHFAHESDLVEHVKTHNCRKATRSKKVPNEHAACSKAFQIKKAIIQRRSLRAQNRHNRTFAKTSPVQTISHSGKAFKHECSSCHELFTSKAALEKHKSNFHREKQVIKHSSINKRLPRRNKDLKWRTT